MSIKTGFNLSEPFNMHGCAREQWGYECDIQFFLHYLVTDTTCWVLAGC